MFYVWGRLWRRPLFRARRDRLSQELAEEIELHLSLKEYAEAGGAARKTTEQSRREMGNLTLAKEESREMWGFVSVDHLLRDVRYALRFAFSGGIRLSPVSRYSRLHLASPEILQFQHHRHAADQAVAVPGARPACAHHPVLSESAPRIFPTALQNHGRSIR